MGEGRERTVFGRFVLRKGHGFPWTEAMARSQWKQWVWWSLQVLRVALVVLVLVLIRWGIKALVDRQEAMEASQVIALTAVLVTGLGAVFTVAANAWLGRKRLASEERRHTERLEHENEAQEVRLAHEERLQEQRLSYEAGTSSERLTYEADMSRNRLAHERAEAVRTTAARAYSAADAVVRHVNQNTIFTLARHEASELGAREAISRAMDDLGFVTALGWSPELRDSAKVLLDEISKLANTSWAHVGAIRNGHETTAMMDRLEQRENSAHEALDAYREAVAE